MNIVRLKEQELTYGVSEEIKTLRTNLIFSGIDKRVLLMTSCVMGEGKSSTALELARSLVEIGKRVLLIDADLRRSVMIRNIENGRVEAGLSHYLSGQSQLSDVVCKTNVPRLHIIFAGPVVPNPTELFSKSYFEKTVDSLKETYDYILIDTAPIGMVIDAAIISRVCDASVLVMQSGEIKRKFAQQTVRRLKGLDCPLLGVVLTKVDQRKTGGYYGRHYKKYYEEGK